MVKLRKDIYGFGITCLSTMLLMSSCSKEDALMPIPESAITNQNSNLKTNADVRGGGLNVLPEGWMTSQYSNSEAGTSTSTHLWGNAWLPWIKPLAAPVLGAGNVFVTLSSQRVTYESYADAKVIKTIKNLIPGKKYAITIYASTTNRLKNGKPTEYAKNILFNVPNNESLYSEIDLQGKENQWVAKTFTFEADSSEREILFWIGLPPYKDYGDGNFTPYLQYAHLYIAKNAVKQLN